MALISHRFCINTPVSLKFKLMRKTALFLFICLAFISCGSNEEPVKEKSQLDELRVELARLEKMFAEIHPEEIMAIVTGVESDMDSAFKLCQQHKVTLTPDEGTFFGRYQALRSGIKKFDVRYDVVKHEIENTNVQLANLGAAIKSNKLDAEAIKKYSITEKIALEKLTLAVEQLHSNAVYAKEGYQEYRPQLMEKLVELSKRKK